MISAECRFSSRSWLGGVGCQLCVAVFTRLLTWWIPPVLYVLGCLSACKRSARVDEVSRRVSALFSELLDCVYAPSLRYSAPVRRDSSYFSSRWDACRIARSRLVMSNRERSAGFLTLCVSSLWCFCFSIGSAALIVRGIA